MGDRRFCRACDRLLSADYFGDARVCRRCSIRSMLWICNDLEAKGYPYVGKIRRELQRWSQHRCNDDQGDGCGYCGEPLPVRATGRPATYCSSRCRQAAWRRNRNETRQCA